MSGVGGIWAPIGAIVMYIIFVLFYTVTTIWNIARLLGTSFGSGGIAYQILGLLIYIGVYGWFVSGMVLLIQHKRKINKSNDPIDAEPVVVL